MLFEDSSPAGRAWTIPISSSPFLDNVLVNSGAANADDIQINSVDPDITFLINIIFFLLSSYVMAKFVI